jgi:O-antigen/teichoic acid export membrane protein
MHLARTVSQRPERASDALGEWLRLRAWTSLAGVALVAAGAAATGTAASTAIAILLFTVVYVVNGLVEFINYFYRGLGRSDIESTLAIAQRSALLVIAAVALWIHPTVAALAVAMLIPAVATLAVTVRRARALASPLAAIDRRASGVKVRAELLRDVMPIGAGIVFSALYFRIDVLLLQLWSGTDAVATYNAVFRLVEGMRLLPAAVLAVALPALCQATTTRPLVRLSAALTGGAIATAGALWLIAGWLVPLVFGAGYQPGVPAFRVLLAAFPLMSLNYALTSQLIGWHRHRAYAGICAAALLFNVTANAAVLPAFGSLGAAWTTLGTEVAITLGCIGVLVRGAGSPAATLASPQSQANPVGAI